MRAEPDPTRDDDLAALSLGLMRSVLDGGALVPALAPLARRLGASGHSLYLVRYREGRPVGSQAEGHNSVTEEARAAYAGYWVRHCPRARALSLAQPGAHDVASIVPLEEWRASRVWTAWGRPAGAAYHALTAMLRREGDAMDALFFHRRESEAPFGAEERALLERVFPDLRRAFAVEARVAAARHGPEEAARRGLESVPDGIALVDTSRKLVFANAALHRIVAESEGFRLGDGGLEPRDPALRLALARAVTAALAAAEGRLGLLDSAGSLAVPRPDGRPPLLVRALPVRPGAVAGGFRGAMLVVVDGARRARPSPALLGRMFGLTPAEASLAATLAAGRTVAEHAKRRGISVETARSQMAAVRRKTGCRRQAELTALLARLPG